MVMADEKRRFGRELAVSNQLKSGQCIQKAWVGQAGEEHGRTRARAGNQHHLTRATKLHEQAFELVLNLVPFGRGDDPAGPDH
jgi:hypothetical protein